MYKRERNNFICCRINCGSPSPKITKSARFDFSSTDICEFRRAIISGSERLLCWRRKNWWFVDAWTEIVLVNREYKSFSKRSGTSTTKFDWEEILIEEIQFSRTFGCSNCSNQERSEGLEKITSASWVLSIFPRLSLNSTPKRFTIWSITSRSNCNISWARESVEITCQSSSSNFLHTVDFPQAIPPVIPTTNLSGNGNI